MDKGIYTALGSIKADRVKQGNSIHDVANVSTIGFKKAFEASVSTFRVDVPGTMTSRYFRTADYLGKVNLEPGTRISTDNDLDIFIEGKGVMGVFSASGELAFTRRGDLRIDSEGRLINGENKIISSEDGGEISLEPGYLYKISNTGVIYGSNPEEEVAEDIEFGRILLRDASNVNLVKMADGLFKVEGEPPGDFTGGENQIFVTDRALEGSSVKTFDILAQMIELERSYEMKINIVKTLSELGESSNSLMRVT